MGVIVDTSNLITAERGRYAVAGLLERIRQKWGESAAGISAVTITELSHGIERAKTEEQRQWRKTFLRDLRAVMKVHPVTDEITERAGAISGQQAQRGVVLPFADLMIGATALHHGCEVITENVRHFEMIPGLVVKKR